MALHNICHYNDKINYTLAQYMHFTIHYYKLINKLHLLIIRDSVKSDWNNSHCEGVVKELDMRVKGESFTDWLEIFLQTFPHPAF